ncbi:hypothetical protein E2C01_057637 [Portunus trituberculatus]|uniref:Uncharacterized protein n=1 Tax=Portunus trituberculatus TaxID=210409 RepID=A0A5B7H0W4_PORTR|nr:hypothetical protein [Portunus trituberculatus]
MGRPPLPIYDPTASMKTFLPPPDDHRQPSQFYVRRRVTQRSARQYGYVPYQRHTVSNIVIGIIVSTLSQYACTQTTVQRYVTMKNLTHSYM